MAQTCRVVIGQVSYKGPHKDCFDSHFEFFHYLGRLSERSRWLNSNHELPSGFPKLDDMKVDGLSELKPGDPVFEFGTSTVTGSSLVGQARDTVCKRALEWNADYVFFFDDDMIFSWDAFLRLWRHQKPVIGALAFTAREPIAPVLYRFVRDWDFGKRNVSIDIQPIFEYEKDALVQVDAIGTGVVLIDTKVLKEIPGPWFHGEVNVPREASGEDIFFCWKANQQGIEIFCDTSVKTLHVPTNPTHWMDEQHFEKMKSESSEIYQKEMAGAK